MAAMVDGIRHMSINDDSSHSMKKNRIQVSSTKKPFFFNVSLAKGYMQQHNEVELSALAIATVVTIAEILKCNGLAVEKRIITSTVDMREEIRRRPKIEIMLGKSERFDELMAAAQEEGEELNLKWCLGFVSRLTLSVVYHIVLGFIFPSDFNLTQKNMMIYPLRFIYQ